jgi:phenylacetate-CoA ligase
LVQEALEHEHWSTSRWKAWQQERLAFVLNRAATCVPYYREHWSARRTKGDHRSWEYLENWPILEKEAVRRNAAGFVADDCNVKRMFHEHTSGTSGKPLDLWWSRDTVRRWYALFEARCRRWYGVSRYDRWAILGGQLVVPVGQRHEPFWVWNAALNQLYMSSYHLAPQFIGKYLDALRSHRIRYIFGYPSSLYAIAQEILLSRFEKLPMAVVVTNAEPIAHYQRETIAQAFQCSVRETYGMAEIVATASECAAGRLHLWPEVGSVELLEENEPIEQGPGDLVCTGLFNSDMPLIRYRVGDRATLGFADSPCSCGRAFQNIENIEGRIDDVLQTTDGRRIGRLDPIFKGGLAVREAQIIQETLSRVRLRYVPTPEYSGDTAKLMIERVRERMGDVQVILQEMKTIPRQANGKFRSVICLLPHRRIDECQL